MKKRDLQLLLLVSLVCMSFLLHQPKKIQVWLIGDSTVCFYGPERAPITGWGMPFSLFFDSTVQINNRARGGRSTRTFISENRWQPIADSLQPGDYVFMQFGHNDEAKEEKYKDRYTSPEDYRLNLIKFIKETKAKNAFPVVVTPVSRMRFDSTGMAMETHKEYAAIAIAVANEMQVPFIDLDKESRKLMQELGPKASKLLFLQLEPGEHPTYPAGIKDNTHFSELGARKMASIVLASIKEQQMELEKHILVVNAAVPTKTVVAKNIDTVVPPKKSSAPVFPVELIVSKDGTGNYQTIQEAINSTRDLNSNRVVIHIKNGNYHEKLIVPTWKTNISLIGESKEGTVISYDDFSGKNVPNGKDQYARDKFGTFTSYTVLIQGNDCIVENLTIENTAGRVGQAVALHVEADRVFVKNCRILGNQDTLYLTKENSRQYFLNCFIEGTTDFIFGDALAVFENCIINSLVNSYITAASTTQRQPYGFVFIRCKLIADSAATKVFLGRPWRPYAKTVFLHCDLGAHIVPEGWNEWKGDAMFPDKEKTAYYAEFENAGAGASTKARVVWSKQLSKNESKQYQPQNLLKGQDGWWPIK